MDRDELNQILNDHAAWLFSDGREGKFANLKGANLQGADLQGADLQGAHLQGAHLMGANLMGAKLDDDARIYADAEGAILD